MRIEQDAMSPECVEAEDTFVYLLQCPVNARITYATFGIPEVSEREIEERKWGEILSLVKKKGWFNTDLIPRVDGGIEVNG